MPALRNEGKIHPAFQSMEHENYISAQCTAVFSSESTQPVIRRQSGKLSRPETIANP